MGNLITNAQIPKYSLKIAVTSKKNSRIRINESANTFAATAINCTIRFCSGATVFD